MIQGIDQITPIIVGLIRNSYLAGPHELIPTKFGKINIPTFWDKTLRPILFKCDFKKWAFHSPGKLQNLAVTQNCIYVSTDIHFGRPKRNFSGFKMWKGKKERKKK